MTPKDNLLRIIEQLPADKLAELEQVAISMLPADAPVSPPGPAKSFEEASDAVFQKFDAAFRKLAQ